MKISKLKTLHQTNPMGVDKTPYFSWIMESDTQNTLQFSYRIVVLEDKTAIWDTGEVESRKQSFIEYEGSPLSGQTEYTWTVTVRDNWGNQAEATAHFETALLQEQDWKAKWIESTFPREKYEWFHYGAQPAPVLFSKTFALRGGIKRARLYATSYGVYRLSVNGQRPDNREFAPEHTVYRKILYYQTYDVAGLLTDGLNTLTMYVGDGWYLCPQTEPITDHFHGLPSVLFQLSVEYADGRREVIASDGTEQCMIGPIPFSDIFLGEKQDANLPFGAPKPVATADYGYAHLVAQPIPPVRPMKLLPAVNIYQSPKGETIVDFGQIICGRARIHIAVPKDTEVVFEYFEVPDKYGNYFNNILAFQKDVYVSDGKPCFYEAYFTFHGFRYIKVTGMPNVRKEDFTAVLLTTEKENAGSFSCSDARMNQLYSNIRWSQANNMMSIPTDCPTREKAGFTGDIQIYANTALLNEDVTPFLESWLDNLAADQLEDGAVPMTVPFTRLYERLSRKRAAEFGDCGITGIAGWSDAAVLVPYSMYQLTGNDLVLKRHYQTMKHWCDYVIKTAREKRGGNDLPFAIDQYLWNTGFHFGEWLIPSQESAGGAHEICKVSSVYTAPFFGYLSVLRMAEIAAVLETEDESYYADIAQKMKEAIQKGLMKDGAMPVESMGAYVLAFAFDLVPEEYRKPFSEKLVALLAQNDFCLDTGFLATPFLLDAFAKIDRSDLAVKLLWQDKAPSWLYQVDRGATAIWESWWAVGRDGTPIITSNDHYAFGCVDEWIFRSIAGISSGKPGFQHILIHPRTDVPLQWCRRTFMSEYGEIAVHWTKETLEVIIPCNTTATVAWKNQSYEIGSGKYTFV